MKQVDSVFIFCFKTEKYQDLLQKYELIFGIYSERSTLIASIKKNVELLQRQLNVFSFYNEHEEKTTRDISKESAEFLWFQLFKDVLLQMPRSKQAKQELIDFSRHYYRGNRKEHENINDFQQSYELDKSIHWYTKNSFLYRLVNKALRTEDVGQLHIFRFFISDLSSKLAEIHKKQNREKKSTLTLYRGLQMGADELKRLKQNVGSIISANGFLSTSRSKDVAIEFATGSTKRTNVTPVLYEIECNLNASESVTYADITKYSKYAQEQEVLFDLGSTFKIESISENEQLKMILVKLIATDAGTKMAQKYIELNRKMNEQTTPDILFGILLIQMGKYDQSLTYFKNLLDGSNTKVDTARIYNEIGSAYLRKGELDEAYENVDRAYRMMIKVKPSRIKDSSRPMTNKAHIYLRKEMYEKSLDLYFEVLEIREKFYGKKHLDTADALNNIGNAYFKQQIYSEALHYYEKAYEIRQKQLPDVHMDIAASLNNIGLIFWKINDVNTALQYYLKSLNIREQLLPSEHNDIIQSLTNIALLLYENRQLDEALDYFAKVLRIQKTDFDQSDRKEVLICLEEEMKLRQNCPQQLSLEQELERNKVIERLHPEYAFSIKSDPEQFFFKCGGECNEKCKLIRTTAEKILDLMRTEAEQIRQKLNKENSTTTEFTGVSYDDDYYCQTSVESLEAKWRQLHERTCFNYTTAEGLMKKLHSLVEKTYDSTNESNEALHFYEKVQLILENSMSDWRTIYEIQMLCLDRIIYIHQQNDNYKSVLDYLERSLKLQQNSINHPRDIADKLRYIGLIHMTLGDYNSALTSYNDALELLLQSNFATKDQETKLTLKRIDEAKEAFESTMHP